MRGVPGGHLRKMEGDGSAQGMGLVGYQDSFTVERNC